MEQSAGNEGRVTETFLHDEVEKRYLAYALSTIVARALPDVRDGLKPVHRRILFAMHSMKLAETAKMRKSAAVVGEVIGKYHPHGDQAAYDAMVRMAQDFSLRYPLIDGSGNFGSLDGDSPAAMRYTEMRLSNFAGLLMREIDQGTTEFRPTYDGMGDEPLVLPAAVPNLLLNGASGIAVGMSCSFPPHNLREVISACRAMIKKSDLTTNELLDYIKGPDFPTGAEMPTNREQLVQIYKSGHGAIRVRGTFEVEKLARGKQNINITSIPYSVNKARLIERIAVLIKDKKLKQVLDVRDESTKEVRIALELRSGDVKPETVMAFLYKHTDLQINFPVNLIAITPAGIPDRLGLKKILKHFLDFRYEKTTQRLEHRLEHLKKRIHLLEGFRILFDDLDKALKIIRSARSREEAASGLKSHFKLDDEQVDSILEMRLYRLVGMEIGKLLDELAAKTKEAAGIAEDLASPDRLWKIIDKELTEISQKFGDERRTAVIADSETSATDYNPDDFVEYEDVTVILSRHGWIRRMKAEIEDASSLKFREQDGLFGLVRVNTGKTVAIFSNLGKVYVMRAMDIPATSGFGEPITGLLGFVDGEYIAGFIAPDPAGGAEACQSEDCSESDEPEQETLFQDDPKSPSNVAYPTHGVVVTRNGQGFKFDYSVLREVTKRAGRKIANLKEDDELVLAIPENAEYLAIATDSGNILIVSGDQIPVLSGPALGIRLIRLRDSHVVSAAWLNIDEKLLVHDKQGHDSLIEVSEIQPGTRATKGKQISSGITGIERYDGEGR